MKLLKILKKIMVITLTIAVLLTGITFLYMQQDLFGKAPDKKREDQYSKLLNYKDGKFQNYNNTPNFTEGYTTFDVAYEFLFNKNEKRIPIDEIPWIKTDLLQLPLKSNVLVWFGHSSYFLQIDGKRILVDPVFSGSISPIKGTGEAFKGTNSYGADDLPDIDYLFISHDHYDHMDYETLILLKDKVKKVICGLGVGSHLEHWGYPKDKIIEKNWHEHIELDSGFIAYCEPAKHFSGRSLSRNNTLWVSFLLQTPTLKIFLGGDGGYDPHFAEIGKKYGPIDFAILENGQYNEAWKYHHCYPHEVLQAAQDLKAVRLFPVHSSKFALANHPWNEPLEKLTQLNAKIKFPIITPIIGELVYLNDPDQKFKPWWRSMN